MPLDPVTQDGVDWAQRRVAPKVASILRALALPLLGCFIALEVQGHLGMLFSFGPYAIAALFALTFFFGAILGAWQQKSIMMRKSKAISDTPMARPTDPPIGPCVDGKQHLWVTSSYDGDMICA